MNLFTLDRAKKVEYYTVPVAIVILCMYIFPLLRNSDVSYRSKEISQAPEKTFRNVKKRGATFMNVIVLKIMHSECKIIFHILSTYKEELLGRK